jgi:hypothetical protein
LEPSSVTHFGIQNEESDEQPPNASDSIWRSLLSDSNVTSKRDVQDQKHFEGSFSTNGGIQIEESDEQSAKASESI